MKTSLRGRSLFVRRQESGDTIVEVMLAMTILGLVLGAAFVTSRHSLQSGLQASYRDQAESYARQQIELIRELDAANSLTGYKSNRFCIDPSGPSKVTLSGTNTCTLPVGGTAGQYTVFDAYTGDSGVNATKTYSVTVQWPSSTSNTTNQVTLYYKPRNSFVDCASGGVSCPLTPPTSPVTTPPPSSWPYFSTTVGDNPAITYGQPLSLVWSTNPTANTCVGAGPGGWAGSHPVNNMSPGFAISPSPGLNTYTLTCTDFSGNASTQTQVVNVSNAPTINTFYASPNPIPYGTGSGLYWTSSGATNCYSPSFGWIGANGSNYPTGTLTSSTTFSLTCYNGYAWSTTKTATVTVNLPPPQITRFDSGWTESTIWTSKGAPRVLYWQNNGSVTSCNLSGYGSVAPNSWVGITAYPGTYTLTCYNGGGTATSANYSFNYHPSYFEAFQHARFDSSWPGWTWGPVGEGWYGLPGDMSSFQAYGRAAVRDNYGHCYTAQSGGWQMYGWVQDYGLVNDAFGSVDVGHDCGGN